MPWDRNHTCMASDSGRSRVFSYDAGRISILKLRLKDINHIGRLSDREIYHSDFGTFLVSCMSRCLICTAGT